MTPELEPVTAPDPVTDDEAYRELSIQAYALDSEKRRVDRERSALYYERLHAAQKVAEEKHAAALVEKFPNPVAEQTYALAKDAAYTGNGEDSDEEEIEDYYKRIVDLINAALEARA